MTQYVPALINDTYEIILPDFREEFHRLRPAWEKGRLESCAELMKPGMVVYDIGAEHGDFTALYRKWVDGDDGDVVPIEPAAHYWPFIKGTWEANGFTEPPVMHFVGLVGDDDVGDRPLGDYSWPIEADGEGIPDGGFVHLAHNPRFDQTTITDMAIHESPDAIVIDIEGAEWNALVSAQWTLEKVRPIVWVSMHDIGDGAGWNGPLLDWYHKTPDDIHNLMKDFGYSAEELPYNGEGEHFWLYTPQ